MTDNYTRLSKAKKITITVEMGNDAFEEDKAYELEQILEQVMHGQNILMDTNGNKVGTVEYDKPDPLFELGWDDVYNTYDGHRHYEIGDAVAPEEHKVLVAQYHDILSERINESIYDWQDAVQVAMKDTGLYKKIDDIVYNQFKIHSLKTRDEREEARKEPQAIVESWDNKATHTNMEELLKEMLFIGISEHWAVKIKEVLGRATS